MDSKPHQAAVREARRFLLRAVRADWEYPAPEPSILASSFSEPAEKYRERYYGSTDNSDDGELSYALPKPRNVGKVREAVVANGNEDGTAVEHADEERWRERKRRRRKSLEEEMAWNEGLKFWVERRDAWTCAAKMADPERTETTSQLSTAAEDRLPPTTDTDVDPMDTATDERSDTDQEPQNQDEQPTSFDQAHYETPDTLLPIPPPLIDPSNPVRTNITPKAYPDLYSKVIISSRTPSIPINLGDMTRALVQGWKEDGMWPPKMGAAEPSVASRRVPNGTATITAGNRRGSAAGRGANLGKIEGSGGLLAHHPHVKRGVDSVRRVFRLSGSGTTPQVFETTGKLLDLDQ